VEYRTSIEILKRKITRQTPVKKYGNEPVSGSSLAIMLEKFIEIINKGALPDLQTL
jgi:hypothetical protein